MHGYAVLLVFCSMMKFIVEDADIVDVAAGGNCQLEIL